MTKETLVKCMETRIYETPKTYDAVSNLCYEAMAYGFVSVQIFPNMIEMCKEILKDSDVIINALIDYPHGGMTAEQKAREAYDAVKRGAREVEPVLNVRKLKDMDHDYILNEMKKVKEAVGTDVAVKFNIEIEYLNEAEIKEACRCAVAAGIDYISTSTGLYHTLDADKNDVPLTASAKEVALLKKELQGSPVKVQAAGHISAACHAKELIEAGADRISSEYAVRVIKSMENGKE